MKRTLVVYSLVGVLAAFSCSKKSEDETGASEETAAGKAAGEEAAEGGEAAFDVEVKRVTAQPTLAPNATYAEQGLGIEAGEDKAFACVHYSITNRGDEPDSAVLPIFIGADGEEYQVSEEAAGKMPTDWKHEFKLSEMKPAESRAGVRCYLVPNEAIGEGMELSFKDDGWAGKGAWEKTVGLPAATREDAAAAGDGGAADGGDEKGVDEKGAE